MTDYLSDKASLRRSTPGSSYDHPVYLSDEIVPNTVLEQLSTHIAPTARLHVMIMLNCKEQGEKIEESDASDANKSLAGLIISGSLTKAGNFRRSLGR